MQSSHLLIRAFGPNKEMWWLTYNDNTCTSGRCTSFKTPDDGRLRPKHVEWLCRNKTCTVLHQVGVSFDWQSTASLLHERNVDCLRHWAWWIRLWQGCRLWGEGHQSCLISKSGRISHYYVFFSDIITFLTKWLTKSTDYNFTWDATSFSVSRNLPFS